MADYGRFENLAGVSVLWDLNQAVVTFGYDHYTFIALNDDFEYLDRNADIFSGSIGFTPNSTMTVGVEGSATNTYYDMNVLNDSLAYSAGLFLETQLSANLRVRIAGGYQWIDFDNTGIVNDAQDVDDYYANLVLSHRVNSAFTHNIAIGHENTIGVNSNYVTLNYACTPPPGMSFIARSSRPRLFYEDAAYSGWNGTALPPGPGLPIFNPFVSGAFNPTGGPSASSISSRPM